MGLTDALAAYNRFQRLCPACQKAALAAGKRIESNCHAGKHAGTQGKGGLLTPPPF